MNWRLILGLSLFGLVMAFATVFVIPSGVEPIFWLGIFLVSAYVIAKRCESRPFLHGLFVSLANSVWITGAHLLLFDRYMAHHPQEAALTQSLTRPENARLMMAAMGPLIGAVSGVVLGFFSLIAFNPVARRPSSPDPRGAAARSR